jgi:hypothetical protein
MADFAPTRIPVRIFFAVQDSELPMFVDSFLRKLPQLYNIFPGQVSADHVKTVHDLPQRKTNLTHKCS